VGALLLPSNWNQKPYVERIVSQEMQDESLKRYIQGLDKAQQQKQEQDWLDIINNTDNGRSTKGRAEQRVKEGGYQEAEADFDKLNPDDSQNFSKNGVKGRIGTLKDGTTIIVREKPNGQVTLERQY